MCWRWVMCFQTGKQIIPLLLVSQLYLKDKEMDQLWCFLLNWGKVVRDFWDRLNTLRV